MPAVELHRLKLIGRISDGFIAHFISRSPFGYYCPVYSQLLQGM